MISVLLRNFIKKATGMTIALVTAVDLGAAIIDLGGTYPLLLHDPFQVLLTLTLAG